MKQWFQTTLRKVSSRVLTEGLDPVPAGIAVFWGIFIGIVPIYGLQTLVALGIAFLFRLNKPLVLACTFVNNPLLQPFLVIASLEIGLYFRTGHLQSWHGMVITPAVLREQIFSWFLGSLVLGFIAGLFAAGFAIALVSSCAPSRKNLRERLRFVDAMYALSPSWDRGFVHWKMRLDRIFAILSSEVWGDGTVVDLGCGYGMALCFAASGHETRRIVGCDLNPHRIEVARRALLSMNADVEVCDVRNYKIPFADLILVLDVLQYLSADEQKDVIARCCAALKPGGKLIFRVHDREQGLRTRLTLGLDRLLFTAEKVGKRPTILVERQYLVMLEECGMQVESRHFRNTLPLAHVLFIAQRPVETLA